MKFVDKLCTRVLLLACNVCKPTWFGRRKAGFFPTMKSQLSQLP
jgi:hypothetical protein